MDSKRYKYPRTYHLPWSLGKANDDKTLQNVDHFVGKQVVVTEKMDGENSTLYWDYMHARSIDGRHHYSRAWVKALQAGIAHAIPIGWRICGENLYAKHSIGYDDLPSYFMAFSVWDGDNVCLDWESTVEFCHNIGLHTVPVLWKGEFNEQIIRQLADDIDTENHEGYVVRLMDEFHYDDFTTSVAKFVRADHVQSEDHWMHQEIKPNKLRVR